MNLSKMKLFKKSATLKKYMLRKSNCCVETVTLKKFEEVASPKKSFSQPVKYLWGISYGYLSGWPELIKDEVTR